MNKAGVWDDILDSDESIVWQGRPDDGLQNEYHSMLAPIVYLAMTAGGAWMLLQTYDQVGLPRLFAIAWFGLCLYALVGVHFVKAFQRRFTHYALTNKRAFVVTSALGWKRQKSFPITNTTKLELVERNQISDLYFATKTVQQGDGFGEKEVGFERLANGREVFALMSKVQAAA